MARYIKVSLEHHQQRRYQIVNYGRGRRPAETKCGKFNLRFRHAGKRARQPPDREREVLYTTDRCVDFVNCTVSVRHNSAYGWRPRCTRSGPLMHPRN
jgi:hypothetical protein